MSTETTEQPQTAEQQIAERATGVERWDKFEARLTDRPETPSKGESEGTLTAEQQKAWNAEKAPGKGDAKPEEATEDGKVPAEKEAAKEAKAQEQEQPQTNYDRLLERASREPDFDQVVSRLHEPFFPLSQEGHARFQVLEYAVSQCCNPQDVVYFLSRPENASVARSLQDCDPWRIGAAIHGISADLRFGVKRSEKSERPKPSAPRPYSEVGGRTSSPDDPVEAAERRGNFKELKDVWNRQATARGR